MKSFYLNTERGKIFYSLIGNSNKNKECTIYFAPLFEERMWSHRIAFNFANDLWEHYTHPVCLFDYFGYGESDGNSEDFSIEHCMKDLSDLINLLKIEHGFVKFILWGIRSGCKIAYECSAISKEIIADIFWSPVFNLKEFINQNLRFTISTQTTLFKKIFAKREEIINELLNSDKCEREGYQLNYVDFFRFGSKFYKELLDLDNCNFQHLADHKILVVDIPRKSYFTESEKECLNNSFKFEFKTVDEKEFWILTTLYSQRSEKMYNETIDWYKKTGIIKN